MAGELINGAPDGVRPRPDENEDLRCPARALKSACTVHQPIATAPPGQETVKTTS